MDHAQPVNRIAGYFATMADNFTQERKRESAIDSDSGKNEYARELIKRMAEKGLSIADLARLVTERGNVTLTERRVIVLRSDGVPSMEKARKAKELFEIAQVLGCEVIDMFPSEKPAQAATQKPTEAQPDESDDIEEAFRMCRKGLQGPKAKFLLDAIEMAYTAALMSKRNY